MKDFSDDYPVRSNSLTVRQTLPGVVKPAPAQLAKLLRQHIGLEVSESLIEIEWRWWRWIAYLPEQRIAFIPVDQFGVAHLAMERRILQNLSGKVSYEIPRVEYVGPEGAFDVRRKVQGYVLPNSEINRFLVDRNKAERFALDFGRMLCEFHLSINREDLIKLVVKELRFPPPAPVLREWIEALSLSLDIKHIISRILTSYDELTTENKNVCLCHGDARIQNVTIVPETGEITGLFDFDGAGIGDPHSDLAHLLSLDEEICKIAVTSYNQNNAFKLSLDHIKLLYLAGIVSDLAVALNAKDEPSTMKLLGILKRVSQRYVTLF